MGSKGSTSEVDIQFVLGVLHNHCEELGTTLHTQPSGKYLLNGMRYNSRPEAACGVMLETYLKGFHLTPWINFQVPVGVSTKGDLQTVDFRIGDLFVEYHPPRIYSQGNRRSIPKRSRAAFYDKLKRNLQKKYRAKRMGVLRSSPIVKKFNLLVLASPEELYSELLVKRAARKLPTYRKFSEHFKTLMKQVVCLKEEALREQALVEEARCAA